jgi:hypothetical protein
MFLLYHSEGCNICEMVFHECYVNDLHTITCSGMLGHHSRQRQGLCVAVVGLTGEVDEGRMRPRS